MLRLLGRGLSSSMAMELRTNKPTSVSKRLWDASKREAFACLYHPFVVSIAAGTLKLQSFQQFIAQDSFFLTAFAEAYGLAMEKSKSQEARSEISHLQQAVYEELELHSSLMKAWNLNQSPALNPATAAYTDFLLAVSPGKDIDSEEKLAVLTLAAMAPCMRLYAYLLGGETKVLSGECHPYRDWIATYSSPAFEAAAARIEQLVDKLSQADDLSVTDFERTQSLYHRAMVHELNFFDAQAVCNASAVVPLLETIAVNGRSSILISDFDSTCTVSDSCPVLADLAMGKNPNLKSIWSNLSDEYFKDYSKVLEDILDNREHNGYDYDAIRAALQTLSEFEKRGNSKMVAASVLQGIKTDEIKQAGGNMPLQAGCGSALRRLSSKMSCQILSVCWSQTFIQSALSKENINDVIVHSNELETDDSDNTSTGKLIRRIETPIDKEETMIRLISRFPDDKLVIFIGDSLTDLLAFLRADIGIVLGSSSSLDRAARAFGVKIIPLFSGVVKQQQISSWTKQEGVLYRASGWLEIESFLAGYDHA